MLKKSAKFESKGPVVVVVMDGIGINPSEVGNAVAAARTPTLDRLAQGSWVALNAHGTAVGMPSDADMGNSEVGHNALGAGQVYNQGAALVAEAIASGEIWENVAWQSISAHAQKNNSTLHLLGLFSDGNVHSHIDHLRAMISQAKADGIKTVRVHALIDGRDVPETSALDYVLPFEAFCAELNDDNFNVMIASGGGRQKITMDRYEANWKMVEDGWHVHVLGEGPRFASASEAIEKLREQNPGTIDQDLPAFIIEKDGQPAGTIEDGDAVVFFNFRGDRSLEITQAFEQPGFDKFDRVRVPKVAYAGMLQYDGDLQLPKTFLVNPPAIKDTLGEWLAKSGVAQFACSETQKYGHVTYFWNGNKSGKFSEELETYVEVLSDVIPFEQRPWMKCAEVTDELIKALESGKYQFLRVNYPNGDMVGHTGNMDAAVVSIEAMDLQIARLLPVFAKVGATVLITADHGNADEMYEVDKKTKQASLNKNGTPKAKTSHTLNQVPCYLFDGANQGYQLAQGNFGLSNVAATVAELLGFEPHAKWDKSMMA